MHIAADQMRPRPDSALSTPPASAASNCVVRCSRVSSCGTIKPSAASAIAPNANTASSRFQPSRRQPDHSRTSAYEIHAARAPANNTIDPTTARRHAPPRHAPATRGRIQRERRHAGQHLPELEVARPEDAAQAIHCQRFCIACTCRVR
jgi:hypothetical protein